MEADNAVDLLLKREKMKYLVIKGSGMWQANHLLRIGGEGNGYAGRDI